MRNLSTGSRGILLAAAILFLVPSLTPAQTSNVQPRITAAIDEANLTTLRGNTHPLARPQYDRGPAPASLPMERMLLVLNAAPSARGAEEEAGAEGAAAAVASRIQARRRVNTPLPSW